MIIFIIVASLAILYYNFSSGKQEISCTSLNKISSQSNTEHVSQIDYNIPGFPNIQTNIFFDISCDSKKVGTVEIELFDDDVPNTSKNFRYLCSGLNTDLSYTGSLLHRIIEGHLIQGGDITNNDGSGGCSAYGEYFEHENYNLKHNQEGLVSMANCGKGRSNSQFLISTRKGGCKELDGKYVVCGIVVKGYDIIKKLESSDVSEEYCPVKEYKITKCGLVGMKECIVEKDNSLLDDLDINEKFSMNIKLSI